MDNPFNTPIINTNTINPILNTSNTISNGNYKLYESLINLDIKQFEIELKSDYYRLGLARTKLTELINVIDILRNKIEQDNKIMKFKHEIELNRSSINTTQEFV